MKTSPGTGGFLKKRMTTIYVDSRKRVAGSDSDFEVDLGESLHLQSDALALRGPVTLRHMRFRLNTRRRRKRRRRHTLRHTLRRRHRNRNGGAGPLGARTNLSRTCLLSRLLQSASQSRSHLRRRRRHQQRHTRRHRQRHTRRHRLNRRRLSSQESSSAPCACWRGSPLMTG